MLLAPSGISPKMGTTRLLQGMQRGSGSRKAELLKVSCSSSATCTHRLLFYLLHISSFSRNLSEMACIFSFEVHLLCNRATTMCCAWCAKTWPSRVTAPPLQKGILVRKDLREEVQGRVCSSCLAEEEILILLCQQKAVNGFLWSPPHTHPHCPQDHACMPWLFTK